MKFYSTILFSLVIILFSSQYSFAQNDDPSIGIRLTPDGAGGSGKLFFKKNLAFEGQINMGGIVGGGSKSYTVVGLLEYHIPLSDPSWNIFFGGGLHAGIWQRNNDFFMKEGRTKNNNQNGIFGIDVIGGVEYSIKHTPLSISADFKPAINFYNEVDLFPNNMFGISLRYHLK